jgi:hypothetical protein
MRKKAYNELKQMIKNKEIFIDTNCKYVLNEMERYEYKTHSAIALGYALEAKRKNDYRKLNDDIHTLRCRNNFSYIGIDLGRG